MAFNATEHTDKCFRDNVPHANVVVLAEREEQRGLAGMEAQFVDGLPMPDQSAEARTDRRTDEPDHTALSRCRHELRGNEKFESEAVANRGSNSANYLLMRTAVMRPSTAVEVFL